MNTNNEQKPVVLVSAVLSERKESLINGKRLIKLRFVPPSSVDVEGGNVLLWMNPVQVEQAEKTQGKPLIVGTKYKLSIEL